MRTIEAIRRPVRRDWTGGIAGVPGRFPRYAAGLSGRTRVVTMALLGAVTLAATAGLTLLVLQARHDGATVAAKSAAVRAARQRTAEILSYSSATLDRDLRRAKAGTTGSFQTDFDLLSKSLIGPAVREKDVTTTATVKSAAVVSATPNQVVTLVFVDQVTKSAKSGSASNNSSQLRVTMTNVHGSWLVSAFQPI